MKISLSARLQVVTAMAVFGTVGLFRRALPLPSGIIACARGFIGAAFLLTVRLFTRQPYDRAAVRRHLPWLLASGAAIGVNWILLFEAYNYTTVATATVCYYMAPVFVMVAAPFLLHEHISRCRALCAAAAAVGIVGVSGLLGDTPSTARDLIGIALGLGAAVLYAAVMLMGRKTAALPATDKTVWQLGVAGAVLLPYCLFTGFGNGTMQWWHWLLLLGMGILHTGIAYLCYFAGMSKLPAQTTAILSYIDPVLAVILSTVMLRENMDIFGIVGTVLVLGAALVSELSGYKHT